MKLLIALAAIFLSVIIFFLPLCIFVFNYSFYDSLYTDNGVYETLDKNDVREMTYNVYDFFKHQGSLEGQVRYSDPTMSSVAFFNDDEISHMGDVRDLLMNIFTIFIAAVTLFLLFFILTIFLKRGDTLKKTGLVFLWSSLLVLALFVILFILSSNFSSLFDNFHLMFFPQGNYAFPQGSLLITMFPFNFFYQFFLRMAVTSSIISATLLMLGIIFTVTGIRKGK